MRAVRSLLVVGVLVLAPSLHAHAAPERLPPPAPAGQSIQRGVLHGDAAAFGRTAGGWTSYGGALVAHDGTIGHQDVGALRITAVVPWSGAQSPAVPVRPGDRYAAYAYVRAASAGQMSIALQFHSADGSVLLGATQISQPKDDPLDAWTRLRTAEGIAPDGASTVSVLVMDDNGAIGGTDRWVDDVTTLHISGTPKRIAAPLHTRGRYVLDRLGRRVTFRGVTLDGLEVRPVGSVPVEEVDIAWRWGANVVRIPLSENYWLADDCSAVVGYPEHVDELVHRATSLGMFVLLDLHTNSFPACDPPRQQRMPDALSVQFWSQVAERYRSNARVGFELYNEPHDVSGRIWRDGGTLPALTVDTYDTPGMKALYNAVRGTGATNLVFISGTAWATKFPPTAPIRGTSNVVYGVHGYTCPGVTATPETCSTGPDGSIYDPTGILGPFLAAAPSVPVMLTEFGFPNRNDQRFLSRGITFAQSRHMAGWSAFAFDNSTLGAFDLWRTPPPLAEPSAAGMAVMLGLSRN